MHWSLKYLSLAWRSGACDSKAVDCWGLVRRVYAEKLGVTLPPLPGVDELGFAGVGRLVAHTGALWKELTAAEDLCVVAMARNKIFAHVGVAVDCGKSGLLILHAQRGAGVALQTLAQLKASARMTSFKFYTLKDGDDS